MTWAASAGTQPPRQLGLTFGQAVRSLSICCPDGLSTCGIGRPAGVSCVCAQTLRTPGGVDRALLLGTGQAREQESESEVTGLQGSGLRSSWEPLPPCSSCVMLALLSREGWKAPSWGHDSLSAPALPTEREGSLGGVWSNTEAALAAPSQGPGLPPHSPTMRQSPARPLGPADPSSIPPGSGESLSGLIVPVLPHCSCYQHPPHCSGCTGKRGGH